MWRKVAILVCVGAACPVFVGAACATASAAEAADGRAYELVSPPIKNGADVGIDAGRTRAAQDGSAVTFFSLGGFADVRGTGVATEYMGERASSANPANNGWTTHAITPKQSPLSLFAGFQALDPVWEGEFSDDLSRGVFRAWSPVTDEDPNVVNVENLYARDDLRAAGAGHYRLLTGCPSCGSPFAPFFVLQQPFLLGASGDFGHVIYRSSLALTADATPGGSLYESTGGTVRLSGVLPDTACGVPPCPASGSTAGDRAISRDGSRIVFTDTSTGQIYERIDGAATVPVSASERTPPDPGGTQPATYATSSDDGSRVFFITSEQLTNDDMNGTPDLYMWTANPSLSGHLTRISVEGNPAVPQHGGVAGVIGASADGRYVYFICFGKLIAGQPGVASAKSIYAWHEAASSELTYVGALVRAGDVLANASGSVTLASRVSPDGRHMEFISHAGTGLLSVRGGADYDQTACSGAGCTEVYVYSADDDTLSCASCDPSGAPATTNAFVSARAGTGSAASALHRNHPLSADGRFVFFNTAESLVTGDSNGKIDPYAYDTQTHGVQLLSTGTSPFDSYFLDASGNGHDAFIITRQQLVGWDTDANYDLYDARIGGGFPEPAPARAKCIGDACQGLLSGPPASTSTGSAISGGDGNFTTSPKPKPKAKTVKPKKCKRGYTRKRVRGKTKCVKKKQAKKARRAATRRTAR